MSNNLHALLQYKLLIESGIVVLTYDRSGLCNDCFNKHVGVLTSGLYEKLLGETQIVLTDERTLTLRQRKRYTDLPIHVFRVPPKSFHHIKKYPFIIPKTDPKYFEFFNSFFGPVVRDIVHHRESVINGRSSYLTDRVADGDIIELAKYHADEQQKSTSLLTGMKHMLPFIEGASINSIIELRQKDGLAFELYRDSIRQLFSSIDANDPDAIQEAVQDIVMPEVRKVKRLIQIHKEKFAKKLSRQVIYNSIVLTAGIAASIATKTYEPLIGSSALIGLHPLSETTETLIDGHGVPNEAKANAYYFLWQLSNEKSGLVKKAH